MKGKWIRRIEVEMKRNATILYKNSIFENTIKK